MSKFFIERPIFAWVIAVFIMVAGAVSITKLPIAQYPPVAPPTILVSVAYPGATAQTLEDSVLSVIEREMNGATGLAYIETTSQANGTGSITLSFFTYAFVNMGMVSGILPVVGIPLPFMSYGGTALVMLFLGLGILMSIQSHRMLVKK